MKNQETVRYRVEFGAPLIAHIFFNKHRGLYSVIISVDELT